MNTPNIIIEAIKEFHDNNALNWWHTDKEGWLLTKFSEIYAAGFDAAGHTVGGTGRVMYQRGIKEGAAEERQFILNVLDGIDFADEQMGLPQTTKAIRFALHSRSLPDIEL